MVEFDFRGLSGGGFAQGGGEKGANAGEAGGKGEGLPDEKGAEIDGLAASECEPDAGLAAPHLVVILHIVEDERGIVEKFDSGGESDALLGGHLQACCHVEGQTGADAFAGALEEIVGGLPEMAGSVGGSGEELLDEREVVIGAGKIGGAARGRHGGRKSGRSYKSSGRVGWKVQ